MTTFVDRVELHVSTGDGGHGVASVHREKFTNRWAAPTGATAGAVAMSSSSSSRP